MPLEFPDQETLLRYLTMLRRVIVDARFRAYETDPQIADLLDAVENVPDLLTRWPQMKEGIVLGDLETYEAKYLGGEPRYSEVLRDHRRDVD